MRELPQLNKFIGSVCMPAGILIFLIWKDLGATVFLIGAVNYVLYKRKINGAII